jgi:hypothetical protein
MNFFNVNPSVIAGLIARPMKAADHLRRAEELEREAADHRRRGEELGRAEDAERARVAAQDREARERLAKERSELTRLNNGTFPRDRMEWLRARRLLLLERGEEIPDWMVRELAGPEAEDDPERVEGNVLDVPWYSRTEQPIVPTQWAQ